MKEAETMTGITKGIVHDYIEDNLTGFGGFYSTFSSLLLLPELAD